MKKQTMITLEEEVIEKAKEKGLNVSGTCNNLLKDFLEKSETREPTELENEEKEFRDEEQHLHNQLMEKAKEFWLSDIGRAVLRKNREGDYGKRIQKRSEEGIQDIEKSA